MKPWLGTSEFLTDDAEQALLEQRGREILAQQARREAKKVVDTKAKNPRFAEGAERRKAA